MIQEKTSQEIQDEIDEEKAKRLGKKPGHHLTKLTGLRDPSEYVVCTDGTEIAYNRAEEERLYEKMRQEIKGKGRSL